MVHIRKINYKILTIAVAVLWAGINLWYILIEIYSLNNSQIVDTSTALQSLKSIFLFKPFLNTDPGGSYFAVHASEFLYLLLPGFTLNQGFATLYITQLIVTYSASVPLFLLARKFLKDDRSAFFIAMVYIFFPYINNSPFELLSLFMGLIIFSIFFLESKHFIAFAITFLLSLSTMEFSPLIGVYLGLYLLLVYSFKIYKTTDRKIATLPRVKQFFARLTKGVLSSKISKTGLVVAILSVSFYFVDSGIISFFSHGTHPITSNLAGAGFNVLPTIPSKIESFMELNTPLALMSFFDPVWILELPWILVGGITNFGPYWSPTLYYDSYVVPFVVISAIYGIRRISRMIKDRTVRTKFIRVLSGLTLLVSVVLLISTSIIPMVQGSSSFNTANGSSVSELASLIPSNQSVYTGPNELPIVSSQAWNTWIFGGDRNYTLFNAIHGPPYNLSGYNLVASDGSYVLMSKTYRGPPSFNNYYINGTFQPSSSLEPYSGASSFYMPGGKYSIAMNINYSAQPIYKSIINAGNVTYRFMPEKYVAIQPFTVSAPVNLSSITVLATMQSGYYILQSMITRNLSISSEVTQDSMGRNEYNTPFLQFSYPKVPLSPNVTYYFWLWSSGVPGGLYLPMTNTTSFGSSETALIYNGTVYDAYGYNFNTYSNLTATHKGLYFTLAGGSRSRVSTKIYNTNLTVSLGGTHMNERLTRSVQLTFNETESKNHEMSLQVSSSYLNGSINSISYTVRSITYSDNHTSKISKDPYVYLIPIFAVFLILIACSFMNASFKPNRFLKRIFSYLLAISTVSFYTLLTMFYYSHTLIMLPLQVSASIMIASLFVLLFFGGFFRYDEKSEDSFLSFYGDED